MTHIIIHYNTLSGLVDQRDKVQAKFVLFSLGCKEFDKNGN